MLNSLSGQKTHTDKALLEEQKEIYSIYNDIMKLHLKYMNTTKTPAAYEDLTRDINQTNSRHNRYFCNAMTAALMRWFSQGFPEIGRDRQAVLGFYAGLWQLHKRYIGAAMDDAQWQALIDCVAEYGQYQLHSAPHDMVFALLDELELAGKTATNEGSRTAQTGSRSA